MAKILISIDHKWRDLPGYVYAGLLLEQRGHQVQFVRNGLHPWVIPNLRPDVVVLVHLFEASQPQLAKDLQDQGVKVVLMPTEGIPTLEQFRSFAVGKECDLSGVDLHFVWNEPAAEILSQNKTIDKKKIVVTGVPRFDFYRAPLSKLLLKKEELVTRLEMNPAFPLITFATNFTHAGFVRNKDFFLRDAERLGYKKILENIAGTATEVPNKDFMSRQICLEAFERLLDNFEKVNFILKLHPSEDQQHYREFLQTRLSSEARQRVRIITQTYIWDILNATDLELKRSCTTGIESWMLGKPTVEMKLNPDEWYFSPEHASGSDIAESYDGLKSIVHYYLSGGQIRKELQKARDAFLNKWCYATDGQSTLRMVEGIEALLRSDQKRPGKIAQSTKSKLTHLGLAVGDHWLHDIKVYGLKNWMIGRYIDQLGREDKFFHHRDIRLWRERLKTVIHPSKSTPYQIIPSSVDDKCQATAM
ncbi:MAG: hypothetical protein M0036_21245 [Desulfobacteraceae bacterium]|nr:hypothetical protein [Desulfobacteraceae bacterium]